MRVRGLTTDPADRAPILLLEAEAEADGRTLTLGIGAAAAAAIACALRQVPPPQPSTHGLMHALLQACRGAVHYVQLVGQRGRVYEAEICLVQGGQRSLLRAPAGDAIALALACSAPMGCVPAMLDAAESASRQLIPELPADEARPPRLLAPLALSASEKYKM